MRVMNRFPACILTLLLAPFWVFASTSLIAGDARAVESKVELIESSAVDITTDRPLVLQFWASWCHSCAGIAEDIRTLVGSDRVAAHWAISTDAGYNDALRVAPEIHRWAGADVRVLHDQNGVWARKFSIETVPTVLLLDCHGRERTRILGHLNAEDRLALGNAIRTAATNAKRDCSS